MPDDQTRKTIAAALLAYNAMETTKRRHFDFLTLLEQKKKKFNIKATEEQQNLLASMLKDHDHAVNSFKQQSQKLQLEKPEAHLSMFSYISMMNDALAEASERHDG